MSVFKFIWEVEWAWYPQTAFVWFPLTMSRVKPKFGGSFCGIFLLLCRSDGRVVLHPSSVNSDEKQFPSQWLVYHDKVRENFVVLTMQHLVNDVLIKMTSCRVAVSRFWQKLLPQRFFKERERRGMWMKCLETFYTSSSAFGSQMLIFFLGEVLPSVYPWQ